MKNEKSIVKSSIINFNKNFYRGLHKKYSEITKKRVSSTISLNDIPIKNLENKIAIDIGCGALGLGALNLIKLGIKSIYLFDLNKKNTLDAKKNILKEIGPKKKIEIKCLSGNLENFKFKNSLFDIALCQGVLHHIEKDQKSLKNIYNSLKKGGVLILTVRGKGGLITDITYNVLAKNYHSDTRVNFFFNSIFKDSKNLKKFIFFLKKNSDLKTKKFLNDFEQLVMNKDFLQTLEDRIKSLRYKQYSYYEIKQKLKIEKFKSIKKINKFNHKYKNIRSMFNSFYLNKTHNYSKIFYGNDSSHINLSCIK